MKTTGIILLSLGLTLLFISGILAIKSRALDTINDILKSRTSLTSKVTPKTETSSYKKENFSPKINTGNLLTDEEKKWDAFRTTIIEVKTDDNPKSYKTSLLECEYKSNELEKDTGSNVNGTELLEIKEKTHDKEYRTSLLADEDY